MVRREPVPASEFTRNFGRYRKLARQQTISVTRHGEVIGYFVSADEYEELLEFQVQRRSFATVELTERQVRNIAQARMDKRHGRLDKLLD